LKKKFDTMTRTEPPHRVEIEIVEIQPALHCCFFTFQHDGRKEYLLLSCWNAKKDNGITPSHKLRARGNPFSARW
jgi:hypothetical protein